MNILSEEYKEYGFMESSAGLSSCGTAITAGSFTMENLFCRLGY